MEIYYMYTKQVKEFGRMARVPREGSCHDEVPYSGS